MLSNNLCCLLNFLSLIYIMLTYFFTNLLIHDLLFTTSLDSVFLPSSHIGSKSKNSNWKWGAIASHPREGKIRKEGLVF